MPPGNLEHSRNTVDPMTENMIRLLVRYYHLSEESAREIIEELRDTTTLQSLAGYRVARAAGLTAAHKLQG